MCLHVKECNRFRKWACFNNFHSIIAPFLFRFNAYFLAIIPHNFHLSLGCLFLSLCVFFFAHLFYTTFTWLVWACIWFSDPLPYFLSLFLVKSNVYTRHIYFMRARKKKNAVKRTNFSTKISFLCMNYSISNTVAFMLRLRKKNNTNSNETI